MTEPVILGRQPAIMKCTPSRANAWYGTIIGGEIGRLGVSGGERFTAQQTYALRDLGWSPDTVETITVTRNATWAEAYWPKTSPTPQYQFDCPVISRRRDGRVNIISPSGLAETVAADGWAGQAPAAEKGRGR